MTSTDLFRRIPATDHLVLRPVIAMVAVLLGLCLASPSASAADSGIDPAQANAKAIELSRQGAYLEAIEIWLSLLDRLGPGYEHAHVLHRNIGRNYQRLEMYAPAAYHLRQAVGAGGKQQEKAALWLFEIEEKLKQDRLRVKLGARKPGASLLVKEGHRIRSYPLPLEWWFAAGPVRLDVRCADGRLTQVDVVVSQEQTGFTLGPDDAIAEPDHTLRRRKLRGITWGLLGGASALLAGSAVTFVVARTNLSELDAEFGGRYGDVAGSWSEYEAARDDWDERVASDVTPWEYSSYALLGTGLATAAVGSYLLYRDLTRNAEDNEGKVFLVPAPGGAGLSLTF